MSGERLDQPPSHFRIAWEAYKVHGRVFVLATLALFAAWVILEVSVAALSPLGPVPNVILHLAFVWLFSGMVVALHGMALAALEGGAPRFADLAARLDRGSAYLLWSVALAIALALVVPGIYLAVRYAFFCHVLASRHESSFEALRHAGALTRGRWGEVFLHLLAVLLINLAGAAFLGVGLLVSVPVSLLATSSLYRTLGSLSPASSPSGTPARA